MNTKPVLIVAIVFIFLFITVKAALSCVDEPLCYNEDDKPFCSPTDTTCTYRDFCNELSEQDGDGDGWSDTCDALVNDPTEWVDYDGDGCGHNQDANDLNPAINCSTHEEGDDQTTETATPTGDQGSIVHKKNTFVKTVVVLNSPADSNDSENQTTPTNVSINQNITLHKAKNNTTNTTNQVQVEDKKNPPSGTSQITGNVISDLEGNGSVLASIAVLILAAVVMLYFQYKSKI